MRALPVLSWLALIITFVIFVHQLALLAWVGDDAFITFRVIDNFAHGYGLRWNTYERVQVYTHPLWMLLHIPLYLIWPNIFLVTLGLSYACVLITLALLMLTWTRPPWVIAFALLLPLMASRSWMDYAFSGLENPLSYLLFALFGFLYVHCANARLGLFWLSLVAALAFVNRLDMMFLYAPPLLFVLFLRKHRFALLQMVAGMLPLLAWLSFSLFYYGFLFPNTKYAKLNTCIDGFSYFYQGLRYVWDLIRTDTPTAAIIAIALFLSWRNAHSWWRTRDESQGKMGAIGGGVALTCLYVIWIGGDFMSGRFFVVPFMASLWIAYGSLSQRMGPILWMAGLGGLLALDLMAGHFHNSKYLCHGCSKIAWDGIDDERAFYHRVNGLLRVTDGSLRTEPECRLMQDGIRLRYDRSPVPHVYGPIGMVGFSAGPEKRIMDIWALTDPLLARLPVQNINKWRIGHFERATPQGYLFTMMTGDSVRMEPALREYYEALRLITQGELTDPQRLRTILRFNLGYYDHLKPACPVK